MSRPGDRDVQGTSQSQQPSIRIKNATVEHGKSIVQSGNYNQQFNADTINYTQPRETPPPPLSNIPFPRDPKFVDRKEFEQLQQKLTSGRRVALNGLGGVGKSQLAIEHCHRIRDQSPDTWVFWLHASNSARFDQEIIGLADEIKLEGRNVKDANIYQLLRSWLNDSRKRWLIVLDNADHAEFLFEAPDLGVTGTKRRMDYIPICSHGTLLITTSRKTIAERMVNLNDIINLEPERQHAIELLQTRLVGEHTSHSVEKLAGSLEYIALAISQAAAYINARKTRCTVDDYIKKLEKSEKSQISLLTTNISDIQRDTDNSKARNAILLTWHISFEHIRSEKQSAAGLLSLMSFYDHQSIPDYLLHFKTTDNEQSINEADATRSESSTEDEADEAFEHDLLLLQDFSLIAVTLEKHVLQMHRLVQLATQVWLKNHGQYTQWEITSLQRLDEVYPDPDFEQWQKCRFLLPHASRALKSKIQDEDGLLSLSSVISRAARFVSKQGEYKLAEIMMKRGLDIYKSTHGMEHGYTLASMSDLALTYVNQGRWREAEELQIKVFQTEERALEEDNPSMLVSMQNLASTYMHQHRWSEAEELLVKVLRISERVLGGEHPDTLGRMNNLALTYFIDRRRLSEATALWEKALEGKKRVLGEEHPDTLTSMKNLAMAYAREQGRLSEAAALQAKALEIGQKLLGDEHPSTLETMQGLASIYQTQGKMQQAQDLMKRCAEVFPRVLGKEHPNTLNNMHNLATAYLEEEKTQQAEDLMTRCFEARKRVLGENHPSTLKSMHHLAAIYIDQEKIQQAHDLTTRCVEAKSRVLGEEHPETLSVMHNLALIYYEQGKMQQAQDLMEKCVEARRRVLGATHPDAESSTVWSAHIRASIEGLSVVAID